MITLLALLAACGGRAPQQVSSVDYYGEHYQLCLQQSRRDTQFTHATMHEQALGNALDRCMEQYGWVKGGVDE